MQTWGDLVQADAAICGIPILIYGIYLTLNSLKLARESASAAIQAVSIGMRQAEAAENAANLSIKQMALNVAAQDKATHPMLVSSSASKPDEHLAGDHSAWIGGAPGAHNFKSAAVDLDLLRPFRPFVRSRDSLSLATVFQSIIRVIRFWDGRTLWVPLSESLLALDDVSIKPLA